MQVLVRRLQAGWRRLWRWGAAGPAVEVLEAADAYRRWSDTYADTDNELQRLEMELRADLLPEMEGLRTLDLGAGTGRVSGSLLAAGADVIGVDLVVEMLQRAPNRAATASRVCVGDAAALPFRPHSFDVVVSALTLAHIAALDRALDDIVRIVRPGGSVVITDFHPAATRRGWQRSFRCDGQTLAVRQHPHTLQEYEHGLAARGCPVQIWDERRWRGDEVLFGLRAQRAAPYSGTAVAGPPRPEGRSS